ncbi:hypothetical protein GCM10028778_11730 [Barrientosiimonas marina]|uniref:Phage tail assembly chaperone G n=1 Tax=Lentibacillus kimchii TaxID=1542911 RepID=A0ABW2UZ87_9BACI
MIKLTLRNPETGKNNTYTETFVSSRHLREVVEFGTKTEKGELNEVEQLDEMITIVASAFSSENVTYDSILDGLSSNKLNETLDGIMTQILGGSDEDDESGKQKAEHTKSH